MYKNPHGRCVQNINLSKVVCLHQRVSVYVCLVYTKYCGPRGQHHARQVQHCVSWRGPSSSWGSLADSGWHLCSRSLVHARTCPPVLCLVAFILTLGNKPSPNIISSGICSGGGYFAAGVALLYSLQTIKSEDSFTGDNQVLRKLVGRGINWQWGQYLESIL